MSEGFPDGSDPESESNASAQARAKEAQQTAQAQLATVLQPHWQTLPPNRAGEEIRLSRRAPRPIANAVRRSDLKAQQESQ